MIIYVLLVLTLGTAGLAVAITLFYFLGCFLINVESELAALVFTFFIALIFITLIGLGLTSLLGLG